VSIQDDSSQWVMSQPAWEDGQIIAQRLHTSSQCTSLGSCTMEEVNPQIDSYRACAFELELVVNDEDVNNLLGILSCNGQVINIDSNVFIFATIGS